MKEIHLTKGQVALVDDADFEAVSKHKWTARKSSNSWYAYTAIRRRSVGLHSFLLNPPENYCIDHINGDALDNRRSNLRIATAKENMANQRQHRDSKSPYKGIWRAGHCDRWAAQLVHSGRKIYLGLFKNPEDAARAYDEKALELFGPFARLNFPGVIS